MPIVWIARLLSVPIQCRLSGADIFDALRSRSKLGGKLKVFLFGGAEGVGDVVCKSLNAENGGMACVGALNPGFGSIAEMSTDEIFHTINSCYAELLTVFLSARKAQGWLLQNHERVEIPVRAQFGATINLQAGRVKRAPLLMRKLGFEWLWRIKEEPYLWRRYWYDSMGLFFLLVTSVLPLAYDNLRSRLVGKDDRLTVERNDLLHSELIKLSGAATSTHVDVATSCFRAALDGKRAILIDLSGILTIDARFFGLLVMFRKQLIGQGRQLQLANASPKIRKIFRLNGFEFLLSTRS
jgi:N-acetylglucosaminyldiphosphoundecaprenol N-acetyl-beta-D-mannosaminyltransferase